MGQRESPPLRFVTSGRRKCVRLNNLRGGPSFAGDRRLAQCTVPELCRTRPLSQGAGLSIFPGRLSGTSQSGVRPPRKKCPNAGTVLDTGYDAEWVHTYCREKWGVRSHIPPAAHCRVGSVNGRYRSQMTRMPKRCSSPAKPPPRRDGSSRNRSPRGNLRSWFSLGGLGETITITDGQTVSFGVKHYSRKLLRFRHCRVISLYTKHVSSEQSSRIG